MNQLKFFSLIGVHNHKFCRLRLDFSLFIDVLWHSVFLMALSMYHNGIKTVYCYAILTIFILY